MRSVSISIISSLECRRGLSQRRAPQPRAAQGALPRVRCACAGGTWSSMVLGSPAELRQFTGGLGSELLRSLCGSFGREPETRHRPSPSILLPSNLDGQFLQPIGEPRRGDPAAPRPIVVLDWWDFPRVEITVGSGKQAGMKIWFRVHELIYLCYHISENI